MSNWLGFPENKRGTNGASFPGFRSLALRPGSVLLFHGFYKFLIMSSFWVFFASECFGRAFALQARLARYRSNGRLKQSLQS